MHRAMGFLVLIAMLCTPAWAAALKFTRLPGNQFLIHHQKGMSFGGGGESKATKTAYDKAASVCIAAGFTHLEVQELNVGGAVAGPYGSGASADLRVKFYSSPDAAVVKEKELLECRPMANEEYIELAKVKLAKP